jgi:DNA-binding NtrC family response regulator
MSLFGPLPAQKFIRLLKRVAENMPDREALAEILDGAIEAVGAERGFLFRSRSGGGFRVLIGRKHDGSTIHDPVGRISHHAVRKALETGAPHLVANARRDRRYRTEEGQLTRRRPVSIIVLPIRIRGQTEAGVYLDHRFHPLPVSGPAIESADHWRTLLEIGLAARERERLIGRATRLSERPEGGHPREPAREPDAAPTAPADSVDFHGLLAASPDMLDLVDAARRLGRSDIPVVITGETGTGKEALCRAIHLSSRRAERPFLVVNCGSLPENLLESELFGHARGAFTGADRDREGLLVQGDGGTVLLDEVGDMSPVLQQKLLRFLEDGKVRPVGKKLSLRIDVRILSSTHEDLAALTEAGTFRKDLFFRLRGAVLEIPPLRERREEVLPLAERFLAGYARAEGHEPPPIEEGARDRLASYPWPGNVRELANEMRRLAAQGLNRIGARDLSPFLRGARGPAGADGARSIMSMTRVVSEAERAAIARALASSGGNKSRAANLLGITRKALYRRMARYGFR